MTQFSDKKVVVLGGSRGIGAAIVRHFAAEGAGVVFTFAGSQGAADALAFKRARVGCRPTARTALR